MILIETQQVQVWVAGFRKYYSCHTEKLNSECVAERAWGWGAPPPNTRIPQNILKVQVREEGCPRRNNQLVYNSLVD